jgi:hypothetical protein
MERNSNPRSTVIILRLFRFGFLCELTYLLCTFGGSAIYTSMNIQIFGVLAFISVAAIVLVILAFWFFSINSPANIMAPVIYLALGYLVVADVYNTYLEDLQAFPAFMPIGILVTAIGVCVLGIALLIPAFWIIKIRELIRSRGKEGRSRMKIWKNAYMALIIIGVLGGSISYVVLSPVSQSQTITIQPKPYQAKMAFWALMNPAAYTTSQMESLNNHSALLIPFDTPVWYERSESSYLHFVTWCTFWNSSYPNVQIMPVVNGIPGGFLWDGSAAGSIALAWRILNATIDENLTNVIGLNTDQEAPQEMPYDQTLRDPQRNAESTRLWNDFFHEVNLKYPGRFEFQTTFDTSSALDVFDGDFDLDVFNRNNVLSVPGWDEFAPMIYTAGDYNYQPGVIPADEAHFKLYHRMSILHEALVQVGTPEKIGVYLGITNMSFMSANNSISMRGQPAGTGYDGLVTQALIAKHFECRRLTIFILNTVPASSEPDSPLMGGVFDSYGNDFLDRFNLSVNGPDANTPFEISVVSDFGMLDRIMFDWMANSWTVYVLLGGWLGILFAGLRTRSRREK